MPYIGTSPSNGVRRVYTYTATASQTTFSGESNEGSTLAYVDNNYLDVFQNGILLGSADYTSTNGTSVVLAQAASVNDIIVIVAYDVFSVADTVSKTDGGTFDGNVTMGGTITATGNADFNGDLDVDGTTNLDVVDIDGALTQDGGAVFNEAGADVDFRVETTGTGGTGSTGTNTLFVNGGTDKVGIGTNDPHQMLGIEGPSNPGISIVDTTNNVESIQYVDNDNVHFGSLTNHNVIFRQQNLEKLRLTSDGLLGTDFFMQFPPTTPPSNSGSSNLTYYQNGALTSTDASLGNSPVPQAMTVLKMRLYVNNSLSGGGATVYVLKNGSNITGTNKEIDVTTGTFAFEANAVNTDFSAGDRIGIKIVVEPGASAAWYHVVLLCRMTIA